MIFQATHHVNFAQGEMAMFSTYIALALIEAGVPYWGAFALTVAGLAGDRRGDPARAARTHGELAGAGDAWACSSGCC